MQPSSVDPRYPPDYTEDPDSSFRWSNNAGNNKLDCCIFFSFCCSTKLAISTDVAIYPTEIPLINFDFSDGEV